MTNPSKFPAILLNSPPNDGKLKTIKISQNPIAWDNSSPKNVGIFSIAKMDTVDKNGLAQDAV
jgi:hypothetical protein